MFAKVYGALVVGIDGRLIEVETDVSPGLPQMTIVGLPDNAVRESTERVRTAIRNSGFDFPLARITVNLAPADLRKEGSAFDLAIAAGVLICSGQLEAGIFENAVLLGELSLDGELKPVPGVLSMVHAAKLRGVGRVILPAANADEACLIDGIEVLSCSHIRDLREGLCDARKTGQNGAYSDADAPAPESGMDYSEVMGQAHAKRALMIAAAGMHNVLFIGPPGSGKTMLMRRLPTILPPLDEEEALEVMKIHSVAGLWAKRSGLMRTRPFRAPHHTVSYAGMLGGGPVPKPGEVSLAHRGVLFLDEMPEFSRQVLEVLRQPLEDRVVTISRARATCRYPSFFLLAGSMNPCPCGFFGDLSEPERCKCPPYAVQRYVARISGPLLDRIDIHAQVPRVPFHELGEHSPHAELSSARMRKLVLEARERQRLRYVGEGIRCNSELSGKALQKYCALDGESQRLLRQAFGRLGLSARAYHRILKIARTIADLEGETDIRAGHVAEAIQYRALDRVQPS